MRASGMREKITALAESGRPNVSRLIEADGDVEFVESRLSVPVIGKIEANLAGWQQPDAFLLTIFLNRDRLLAELDAEISAEADDANAMTHEHRQKTTATIASDMLAVDRELSELIWMAQVEGLPIEFRSDANHIGGPGLAACHRGTGQGDMKGNTIQEVAGWPCVLCAGYQTRGRIDQTHGRALLPPFRPASGSPINIFTVPRSKTGGKLAERERIKRATIAKPPLAASKKGA
jgi:hypothetical protein